MAGDVALEYIRDVSRLVDLCAATASGSPLRDAAARVLENHTRKRSFAIELDGDQLRVDDGDAYSFELEGTYALVTAMLSHQVARLAIRQLTPAAEYVSLAALLAVPAREPHGGATIEGELAALRLWNIELVGIGSMDAEPITAALPADFMVGLHDGADYAHAEAALARLATRVEQAIEARDARLVGAVLISLDQFERHSRQDDLRHGAQLALKRLLVPAALRLTAELIPSARRRGALVSVLARTPDASAEALFAQLVAAQELQERRALFNTIVALGAGTTMLLAALDDAQWFVARNAAELLGEMRAEGAETSLGIMLRSPEPRRRVAAASALARLRTAAALATLGDARHDESAQVRFFANTAVFAQIEGASARELSQALEQGAAPELKLQIIGALGRLGTTDAVQRLIKTLVMGDALRDSAALTAEYRCASIEAVAEARGPQALSVIRQYRHDRDPRVRETALRVYARLAS